MTRLTLRSLFALVVAAGLVFLGSSAASAQYGGGGDGDSTFTIDDSTVVAGQTVGVSGTGCAANETVTFTIGDAEVGSTTADGSGNYTGTVTIPSLSAGDYTINASCGTVVLGLTITVGSGVGGTGGTSGLARTGSSSLGFMAGLGAAAVVLGAAAVYGTQRRRHSA